MRFERLALGHVVAAVAALALLLVMAMEWYGSHEADLARRLSNSANIGGGEAGEAGRAVKADADRIIARDEKTPWQEHDSLDRVLLVLLLLAVALPLIAAALRAAGRRPKPPWTASMFAALAAVAAALLVAYRIVNEPGNDAVTTVKTGAPLGLLMLALIGLGSASAFRREVEWAELRERASAGGGATAAAPLSPGEPAGEAVARRSDSGEPAGEVLARRSDSGEPPGEATARRSDAGEPVGEATARRRDSRDIS